MSNNEVNFFVDFDVDRPHQPQEYEASDERKTSDSVPPAYDPALQIVPPTEVPDVDDVKDKRRIVGNILNKDGQLPWIRSPKVPEIGQS